MLVEIISLSWNVQVSCSLLELCKRHVVLLQVKVLQVANSRQLVGIFLESCTSWIFAKPRNVFWSLTRSSWHILFQCGRWISPDLRSLLLNGVGTLRIAEDPRFSAFSLDVGCTWSLSSSSSSSKKGSAIWTNKRFCPLRRHPVLDTSWIRCLSLRQQKLHVSSGEPIAHATKFCFCGRENRICTSPISSTSTLVEHGGFVVKWKIQLSRQVSVT